VADSGSRASLAIARTKIEVRTIVADWRRQGLRVGLAPTMGALHDGHISLVEEAQRRVDRVVVSVFVNPTQFAPHEDLASYPRQEQEDVERLGRIGCHLLYAPSVAEMYPRPSPTRIEVAGAALGLEGDFRPQMFGGVALVVLKLFNQVQPDLALFGEKDWQQLAVIRQLVKDLDLPVEVAASPTVRDGYGLALSSRNAYLSPGELTVARRLNGVLAEAAASLAAGGRPPEVETTACQALLAAGFDTVDYVAVRRAEDLAVFEGVVDSPARVLAAARIGRTRLIDNLPV
jgi:pantoate--beta-alanine ligase